MKDRLSLFKFLEFKVLTLSILSMVGVTSTARAQSTSVDTPHFALTCWEAFVDTEGRWQMGSERTPEQIFEIFVGATPQSVCYNFTNSGGSLNELFSTTGMYCRCSEGESTPTPTPEPTPTPTPEPESPSQYHAQFSNVVLVSSHEFGRFRDERRSNLSSLNVYGVGLKIVQTSSSGSSFRKPLAAYHLKLTSRADSAQGLRALQECKSLAQRARFRRNLELRVNASEVSLERRSPITQVVIDLSQSSGSSCELIRK